MNLPCTRSLLGSRARRNDGAPINSALISVSCIGWNGYADDENRNITESRKENIVLTRNRDAERWILLIQRLPSSTARGIAEKSLSSSTSWDTHLAASLPDCTATEQSASRSASTSFTPSPVIATL